jgi:hypothetical protein
MNSLVKAVLAVFVSAAILAGCGQSTEQDRNKQSKQSNEITAEQMETVMAHWKTQPTGICSLSDETAFDLAGGIATGTALTAHISGDLMVTVITLTGPLSVPFAPAVAPALAVGGGIAALTYFGIKIYCMGQADAGHRISEESEK